MLDFGFGEIILVLAVALIVFGPKRLPDVARKAGTILGQLRRYYAHFQSEIFQTEVKPNIKSLEKPDENTTK